MSSFSSLLTVKNLRTQMSSRTGRSATYTFNDIQGESPEIKTSIAQAKRFATSPENILLIGESGTGKNFLLTPSIIPIGKKGHLWLLTARRYPASWLAVNCLVMRVAVLPGAERCGKAGKIELSHGGTLFLDEIGDMPLEHQAILLRTLQDKKVMRIGGNVIRKLISGCWLRPIKIL